MKITKEIFQVAGPGLTTAEDAASYLIKIGGAAALHRCRQRRRHRIR